MKERSYFMDNLRTFLIFGVIVIHSGLVYEEVLAGSWITIDPDKSGGIGLIRLYLDAFIMYLWFFISGYFVVSSKSSKSFWTFIKVKFTRLILPWFFGIVLLIPLYKYIFLYSRGLPQEEWYSYFHFYLRPGGNPYYFADNPVQNWLWFLPILFLFQLLYLLIPESWSRTISFKKGIVGLVLVGTLYGWTISSLGLSGWYHSFLLHFQNERLLTYFLTFLLGSLAFRQNIFNSIFSNRPLYIWINVLLIIIMSVYTLVALNLFFNLVDPTRNFFFVNAPVDRLVYYFSQIVTMVSISYLILHAFYKYCNRSNSILHSLAKSSYHVYLIHLIVIGIIGTMMVSLSISPWIKYAFLSIATFVVSSLISVFYRRFKGLLSSTARRDLP